MCSPDPFHKPVMVDEVIKWLDPHEGVYLDVTLGCAGHSIRILEANKSAKIIGTDRDDEAISIAKQRLGRFESGRVVIRKARFSELADAMGDVNELSGAIADLGVCSRHLDVAERGFSFQMDGPLDMRMGEGRLDAACIVNEWPEHQIEHILKEYGEEPFAKRIARAICTRRRTKRFERTLDLASVIASAVPARGKINPATRTFQALRIAVNDELGELDALLDFVPTKLKKGARFVVISYHSLEDRRVKRKFRELNKKGFWLPVKKVIMPSQAEQRQNRRSRSAKMRVLEKA